MKNSPHLTIVIPVYNLETYIEQTILSCFNQDIHPDEYEIVCIDDGSKDNSLKVLKSLSKKYQNIKVISKENGGVSQTRNVGLANAKGRYIWFVDGDDILTPNCIGYLLSIAETENPDILWFKMRNFTDKPTFDSDFPSYCSCDNRNNLYEFMFSLGGGGVCVNWYRRELLIKHSISFNEQMKYSEDVLFNFAVLQNAKKCTKTEFVAYHYRQRPGSAMHSSDSDGFVNSMRLLAYEYDGLLLNEKEEKWRKIIVNNRDRAIRALLFSLTISGNVSRTRQILDEMKEKKFYPYKLMPKALIRNNSYKQFLINLISFPFPLEAYTMALVKCFNIFKR